MANCLSAVKRITTFAAQIHVKSYYQCSHWRTCVM